MEDEAVLPSDPEELEELRAEEDLEGYWASVMPAITRNIAIMKAWNESAVKSGTERDKVEGRRLVKSDDEGSAGRPRKRMKAYRSTSDENLGQLREGPTPDLWSSRHIARDISNSPLADTESLLDANRIEAKGLIPGSQNSHRTVPACSPHKPRSKDYAEARWTPLRSQMTHYKSPDTPSVHHDVNETSSSDDLPVMGHSKSSQSYVVPSPTQPLAPLLLFSSSSFQASHHSQHHELSPRRRQRLDFDDDVPIPGPSRLPEYSRGPASSNSTSPSHRSPASPPPQPPSLPSSPLSSPDDSDDLEPQQQPDAVTNALLEELQQQESGRYSLRERNVRQLKPYEYDRRQYVRQMRSNPDAIVKFRSPPRRKHGEHPVSPAEAPSSDGEVNPADLDLEASDDDRRRRRATSANGSETIRRHRRSRSVSATVADGGQNRSKERPRAVPHRAVPVPAPTRDVAEEWYQAKLHELDSSSSEEDQDNQQFLHPQPVDELEPQSRKRRRKRFPMNRARRSKSPDLRLFSQTPSPPHLSRSKRPISGGDSSDVEVISNVAGPSRARSGSAENEQDPWAALDDARFDEQLPSPASNPPTSSSAHVSDGFDPDSEPNIWQTPPRYENDMVMSDADISPSQNEPSNIQGASPARPIVVDASSPRSDDDDDGLGAESMTNEQFKAVQREYKELCRMYPAVQVLEMLRNGGALKKKPHKSRLRKPSEIPEDGPLRPGQTRVRVGSKKGTSLIRGDPESSDAEIRLSSSMSPSRSPSPRIAGPSSTSYTARRTISRTTISISSDSESEDDGMQEDPDGWVNEPTAWHESRRGFREGTLVDYMLNRTNGGGRKASSKRRASRTGRSGNGPRRSTVHVQIKSNGPRRRGAQQGSSTRTRVTVGGARRYGSKRQALLNFPRADEVADNAATTSSRSPATSAFPLDLSVGEPKVSSSSSKPAWKKNRNRTRDRVYFLKPKVVKVVSGRVMHEPRTTVIEHDAPTIQVMQFPAQPPPPLRRPRPRVPLPTRQTSLNEVWHAEDGEPPGAVGAGYQANPPRKSKDTITVDMGITKLPSGIAFSDDTYLVKGSLHDLLSPSGHRDLPPSGYIGLARIYETTSPSEFSIAVKEALTEIIFKLQLSSNTVTRETVAEWQRFLHVIRRWTAWYLSSLSFDEAETLPTSLIDDAQRIYILANDHFAVRADDSAANLLSLQLQWAAIELLFIVRRMADETFSPTGDEDLMRHLKLLVQHLWACNIDLKLQSFWPVGVGRLHYERPVHLVAELWVCVIHLMKNAGTPGAFWSLLQQTVQEFDKLRLWSSKFAASEAMWTCIYGFLALSQFTPRGLTTPEVRLHGSWKFVAAALKQAPLEANPSEDAKIPERGLKKRDKYIKLLISRCLWLHTYWKWSLDDSGPVFNSLLTVFKSRRFANLLHEKVADFPAFLKEHKIDLLFTQHEDDSAFTLFLKLVVKAAVGPAEAATQGLSPNLRKILSLVVPLGAVTFKKSSPASTHESSMLYNRLSAVAVAIYLEQTPANAKNRLIQAGRYVNFKETDQGTRQACIRGVMYLAILLQHLELPLDDALDWLGDMTNCLVDEFIAVHRDETKRRQKNDIVKTIQMILACTRRVIETPCMDNAADKASRYPTPALLQGPWVTRVFSSSATLASSLNTALEMRMLVQAFLKARSAVLPRPAIRHAPPAVQEESQEDYGDFGFDMNDPAVAAALGDAEPGDPEIKTKEEETCKVIDEHISKAVFRVLCAHLSSRQQHDQLDIDRWVECWVGCAEVLVRNGRRTWAPYFDQASQTWEMMRLDSLTLRRINLHFSLTVLKCDPSSYSAQQDHYLRTFFQCMVTPQPELEAEYMGLLFTVDDMQHALLRGIPSPDTDDSGYHQLTRIELMERRIPYLEQIFRNLDNHIAEDVGTTPSASELNRKFVGYVAAMLAAMQETFKSLDVAGRAVYTPLCSKVLGLLSQNANVQQHPMLRGHITWLKSL